MDLPQRIRSANFSLTSYPSTYTDMKDSFMGGPLFLIHFRDDGLKYRLFNAVDSKIAGNDQYKGQWAPDDYVLEIEIPETR